MNKITMANWKATKLQRKLINQVLKSGRLTYGPITEELEEKFAKAHKRKYALFTNSGTSALQIAIHAFKKKYNWNDGDEVIVPALTFVATMNVVLQNNLKPVLCDVNLTDLNLDPGLIEKKITPKTRAIIPVHLLGQSCQMDRIIQIAKKHSLSVIEDSCETMFVKYNGAPVGSLGDMACFSTYLAHLMVTGVGGFITTNNKGLATVMRSMMFHGRHESYLNIDSNEIAKRFLFVRPGYSYRATELEAALGLGEIDTIQGSIKKRQENARYISDRLDDIVYFPINNFDEHAFMMLPIIAAHRDEMIQKLEKSGIQTRTIMPLTNQPWVKGVLGNIEHKYPNAKYINKHGFLVPCHQYLRKNDLNKIVEVIRCTQQSLVQRGL